MSSSTLAASSPLTPEADPSFTVASLPPVAPLPPLLHNSLHTPRVGISFDTVQQLADYLTQYTRTLGFKVTHRNKNDRDVIKGSFHCWCHASQRVKADSTVARTYHADTGKVNCGCVWEVRYRADYHTAKIRITACVDRHVGHILPISRPVDVTVKHLRVQADIPPPVVDEMRRLITFGTPSRQYLYSHIVGTFQLSFEEHLFRNLFRTLQNQIAPLHNEKDWRDAVKWARSLGEQTLVEHDMDSVTLQGRRLLFMSPTMLYNFQRNGEVLVMDTTHGTNRYRYYALLISGVSHYGHTAILAVALIRNQATEDFVWVLNHLKSHLSVHAWTAVKTIFTDGDQAMKAAVELVMPHASHLRCVWHVQQNIASKSDTWLGKDAEDDVRTEFKQKVGGILFADDQKAAEEAVVQLYARWPDARCKAYFDTYILPNLKMFAAYAVNDKLTFNAHSTQRAESIHSLIKRDNHAEKPLTIMTSAIDFLQTIHSVARRHEEAAVERDARQLQRSLLRGPPQGPGSVACPGQTVYQRVIKRLTKYASDIINSHFQAISNWTLSQQVLAEEDALTVQQWQCAGKRGTERFIVTVSTPLQGESNYMSCTCGMPANMLLPCSHVMVLNLRLFGQAVVLDQVGRRWDRDWRPSPIVPQTQPMQYFSESNDSSAHPVFDLPEDEVERQAVTHDMITDDVYAILDGLLASTQQKPRIAETMRAMILAVKEEIARRLIGDFSHSSVWKKVCDSVTENADSGSSDEDELLRLRNPVALHCSKRQKRYEKRGVRKASETGRSDASTAVAMTQ
jgi:hypothetical protein